MMADMAALIIEDDPTQQKVVSAVLSSAGFEVIVCADGIEGLRELVTRGDEIKVAVVDWYTEPLSGLAFVAAARAEERFQDLPILMLSAEKNKERVRHALTNRLDAYLVKPVRPVVLKERLVALGLASASNEHEHNRPRFGVPMDMPAQPRITPNE